MSTCVSVFLSVCAVTKKNHNYSEFITSIMIIREGHGAAGSVATLQLQFAQFDPELGLLSAWSFTYCLCGFPPCSLASFNLPKNMPLGGQVSVNCH